MKKLLIPFTLLFTAGFSLFGQSQTPPATASGKISYEVVRRIDLSQIRMVINGQEVRPGSADAPADLPEVITTAQHLIYSGTAAKEQQDRPDNMMRVVREVGPGGDGQGGNRPARQQGDRSQQITAPFRSEVFLNLATGQRMEVLNIRKDSVTQETYRTDRALPARPADWQETAKTKKIAGYLCKKATASYQRGVLVGMRGRSDGKIPPAAPGPAEAYTIWYTTDLPFTYSPVAALTPDKGVVLQIESDSESYKATGVTTEAIAADLVTPPATAKTLTNDEFQEQSQKARANFRQRMMNQMPMPR